MKVSYPMTENTKIPTCKAINADGNTVNVGDKVTHYTGYPNGVFEGVTDPVHPGVVRIDGRDWNARAFGLRIVVVK
jgi:hypothetical protein